MMSDEPNDPHGFAAAIRDRRAAATLLLTPGVWLPELVRQIATAIETESCGALRVVADFGDALVTMISVRREASDPKALLMLGHSRTWPVVRIYDSTHPLQDPAYARSVDEVYAAVRAILGGDELAHWILEASR